MEESYNSRTVWILNFEKKIFKKPIPTFKNIECCLVKESPCMYLSPCGVNYSKEYIYMLIYSFPSLRIVST